MSEMEKELEARLNNLPDADPDFTRCTMFLTKTHGLVDETLRLLEDDPDATTDTVIEFRLEYCGDLEFYDDEGARIPVDASRLRLTTGMRDMLAQLRDKTFKSYQFAPIGKPEGRLADCNVRINLGQHAIDLNCYNFAFDVPGKAIELGAMHCERMSLHDDFRPWTDDPYHAYSVGERITGVELVTERVKVGEGPQAVELAVDVAVAVRTAHAVYTFARESWASTGIAVTVSDGVELPYEVADCRAELIGLLGGGITVGKLTRKTTKLA